MDKAYLDYCTTQLKNILDIPSPSGFTGGVSKYIYSELKAMGYAPELTQKSGVLVNIGGREKENSLLLGAHVDTLGGMVCSIKPTGRLQISPLGGLDPSNTWGENVTVHTRAGTAYSGTFQLTNASVHVNKEYRDTKATFDNMEVVLDEAVKSKEDVKKLGIEIGDIISFDPRTVITESGYIKSRFLDDKLSSAILLALAKLIKEENIALSRKLYLHFTVYEEVGHGGSASMPDGVTEMIAVDMGCVGEGLDCDETMVSICAKDSRGPSDYNMVSRLISLAKENNLNYAVDVYPAYGSDADAALAAGHDIRHCTVGAGVYASHGYERSHIDGVKNTFDLIKSYILI